MNAKRNYPVIILLVVVAVLAFFLFKKTERAHHYSGDAIMEKIAYVQELSLVKYNYTGVINFKEYRKFMSVSVPLTEKSFLIQYAGYVKAGIDMRQATVAVQGKTVKVTLPKPAVQETVIDEKNIQVYDESMNVLNPIKITDYQKAVSIEKDKIRQNALNKGILTESSDQAHRFITALLEELGFDNVEIVEASGVEIFRRDE